MRAAEQAAFAKGVQVEALMNKAGAGVAQAVTKFFPETRSMHRVRRERT